MSKVEILMTATNKDGAVTTKNLETESAVVITMTNTGETIDGDTAVVGGFGDEFGLPDIDKIIAYAKATANAVNVIAKDVPVLPLIFDLYIEKFKEERDAILQKHNEEQLKQMQATLGLTEEDTEQLLGVFRKIAENARNKKQAKSEETSDKQQESEGQNEEEAGE